MDLQTAIRHDLVEITYGSRGEAYGVDSRRIAHSLRGAQMFWLASCDYRGRRVLLVESDCCTAKAVSSSISAGGGIIVGISASVEGALQVASLIAVDVVFFHVRFATYNVSLTQLFGPLGSDIVFRTDFDEWFDADEEHACQVVRFGGATRLLT